MSGKTVWVRSYQPRDINISEVMRYAGMRGEDAAIESLLRDCIVQARDLFTYRVCFCTFPVMRRGELLDLSFLTTDSRDLCKNLAGCDSVVLFAATVGLGIDRMIEKYGSASPTRALLLQALGAERVESLCDAFCDDIGAGAASCGRSIRPRFSPGYGDFPLEAQAAIVRVLDTPRKLGLTLTDSLLLSPSKSVTALIGISTEKNDLPDCKCDICDNTDCVFRKEETQ